MGARGPVSTQKRKARGKSQTSPAEANTPRGKLPQPPAHLDKIGAAAWRRLVAALKARGMLEPELDFGLLESWAATYAQWRAAQDALKKHGMTFVAQSGFVGQRPEVAIAHKAKLLLRTLAAELGLSTASRARIKAPEPEPNSPDEMRDLLAGRP